MQEEQPRKNYAEDLKIELLKNSLIRFYLDGCVCVCLIRGVWHRVDKTELKREGIEEHVGWMRGKLQKQ